MLGGQGCVVCGPIRRADYPALPEKAVRFIAVELSSVTFSDRTQINSEE